MNVHRTITKSAPRISAAERQKRLDAINFARGSVRLEGFVLDARTEEINRRFVDGELTLEEFIAETD